MDVTGEPGRPAHQVRPLARRLLRRAVRGDLAARRDPRRRAATASAWTATSSLYDAAFALLTYPGIGHLNAGFTPRRTRHSAHPSLVPFQASRPRTRGSSSGCAKEKFWQRLAPMLGHPEWLEDERFATFAAREHQPRRDHPARSRRSSCRHARRPSGSSELYAAGIPCGPINTVARGVRRAAHGRARPGGRDRAPACTAPSRCRGPAVNVGPRRTDHRRAPQRNEHFDYVVRDAARATTTSGSAPSSRPARSATRAAHPRTSRPAPSPRTARADGRSHGRAQRLAATGSWALRLDDGPEPVRHAARRHLLDGVGNALASARAGVVDAPRHRGARPRRAAGGDRAHHRHAGRRPAAALAAGALVHGLDFDDTHAGGLVHATAVVLPAVLAVGEQVEATGDELLAAAVVGYEVVCRVAAASPHGFHARGLHATQVAGTLGRGRGRRQLLGARRRHHDGRARHRRLVVRRAAGVPHHRMPRPSSCTRASAALNGILAARLAAAGASGPGHACSRGRTASTPRCRRATPTPRAWSTGLGSRWEIDAHHDQALPVVPAHARHARRAVREVPAGRGRRHRGDRWPTCTPTRPRSSASRRRGQDRAAHVLRREVLAALVGRRARRRRRGRGRHLLARLDRAARRRGAARAACAPSVDRRRGWRPTPPATSSSGCATARCSRAASRAARAGPERR